MARRVRRYGDAGLLVETRTSTEALALCAWLTGSERAVGARPGLRSVLVTPDEHEILYQKFVQYEFFRQWNDLHEYLRQRQISIFGDLPIYVSHDSADVWSNRDIFELDEKGNPKLVAGVPPDYFSKTGQRWGNPIYDWNTMELNGFRWWVSRFRSTFEIVDIARVDHFRGFAAAWEVPGEDETAENGQWVSVPD